MRNESKEKIAEIKELSKHFKKEYLFEDLNFELFSGEVFGIVGKSGSGKSTLLNILCGIETPSSGLMYDYLMGENSPRESLIHFDKTMRKSIGFSTQESSFYPQLSVLENLNYFANISGISRKEIHRNISYVLDILNLSQSKDKKALELSGGMKKRLDIALSLVNLPKILILDEPTTSLDFKLREEILILVKELKERNFCIIFVSHIIDEIESICDRILILKKKNSRVIKNSKNIKSILKEESI